jgi:hypothetical protein
MARRVPAYDTWPHTGRADCAHLYRTCPAMRHHRGLLRETQPVDPLGSDVCGWCVRVYVARVRRRKNR